MKTSCELPLFLFPCFNMDFRVWSLSEFDSFVFLFVFTEKDGERCCSLNVPCSFSHLCEAQPPARVTRASDGWVSRTSKAAQSVLQAPEQTLGWPAGHLPLVEPEKGVSGQMPRVEGYPRREQEMCSEESYGNFTSSVVRGRCSVPGEPASASQYVHKHRRARWLRKEGFHFFFFGSLLTC